MGPSSMSQSAISETDNLLWLRYGELSPAQRDSAENSFPLTPVWDYHGIPLSYGGPYISDTPASSFEREETNDAFDWGKFAYSKGFDAATCALSPYIGVGSTLAYTNLDAPTSWVDQSFGLLAACRNHYLHTATRKLNSDVTAYFRTPAVPLQTTMKEYQAILDPDISTRRDWRKFCWGKLDYSELEQIIKNTLTRVHTEWTPLEGSLSTHRFTRHAYPYRVVVAHPDQEKPEPKTEQATTDVLTRTRPEWIHRINQLSKLESNWDGYEADVISAVAIVKCYGILAEVSNFPSEFLQNLFIAPLADGGLEIEWEFPSGNELMIVIPPEGSPVRFLLTTLDPSSNESETPGTIPADATLDQLFSAVSA